MTKAEKIQFTLSYLVSFAMLFGAAWSLFTGQWLNAFLALLAFFFTYIPALISWNYKIILPIEFELIVVIFVYATLNMGLIQEYFEYYWWWDAVSHASLGLLMGFVGFLIVFTFNFTERIPLKLSPFFIALFSFTFSMAIGAVWEIYEFGIDKLLGYNWQESSLDDTMSDIILDAIGAIIVSICAYFYVKNIKIPIFQLLIGKFVKNNPKIFDKW